MENLFKLFFSNDTDNHKLGCQIMKGLGIDAKTFASEFIKTYPNKLDLPHDIEGIDEMVNTLNKTSGFELAHGAPINNRIYKVIKFGDINIGLSVAGRYKTYLSGVLQHDNTSIYISVSVCIANLYSKSEVLQNPKSLIGLVTEESLKNVFQKLLNTAYICGRFKNGIKYKLVDLINNKIK